MSSATAVVLTEMRPDDVNPSKQEVLGCSNPHTAPFPGSQQGSVEPGEGSDLVLGALVGMGTKAVSPSSPLSISTEQLSTSAHQDLAVARGALCLLIKGAAFVSGFLQNTAKCLGRITGGLCSWGP